MSLQSHVEKTAVRSQPFSSFLPKIGAVRWVGLLAVAALLLNFCIAKGLAQNSKDGETKVENPTVTAEDGWQIHMTYYPSELGKEAPVVVLLHGQNGNRLVWRNKFTQTLNEQGYAIIAVDLRKHGESKGRAGGPKMDSTDLKPNDYKRMVALDLEAVKDFIFDEHQEQKLNMSKMAIVAPEMSAPIAATFAVKDWLKPPYDDAPTVMARTRRGQDVRALIFLSPQGSVPGISATRALNRLRNPRWGIAFLFAVGTKDSLDDGDTRKMYRQVSGNPRNKDRTYYQTYPYKLRGTQLIGKNTGVERHMFGFLEKHLKDLPIEWKDRRPRYNRD